MFNNQNEYVGYVSYAVALWCLCIAFVLTVRQPVVTCNRCGRRARKNMMREVKGTAHGAFDASDVVVYYCKGEHLRDNDAPEPTP